MFNIKKAVFKGIIIFISISMLFGCLVKADHSQNIPLVTIFHTNDIHGVVEGVGGLLQVSKYVKDYRNQNKENKVLFVNAGDWSRENSYDDYAKGAILSELINLSNFDYVTVGNHEFNFGYTEYLKNIKNLDVPVLQANLIDKNGKSIGKNYEIIEISDKKIGLFSLITERSNLYPSSLLSQYSIVKCLVKAKEVVAKLKAQDVDFIICISHVGKDNESTSVVDLAKVEGIDLIIDGHSHTQCPEDAQKCSISNVPIVRNTGNLINGIGKIDVYYHNGKFELKTERISPFQLNGGQVALDESYYDIDMLRYYRQAVDQQLVPIVKVADINDSEHQRYLIVNTIADGYRYYAKSSIAVVNHGVLKNEISNNDISAHDIYKAIADYGRNRVYPVRIVKKTLSGKAIKKLFEQSLSTEKGNTLQISGAQIIYNSKANKGKRVKNIYINGKKLKNRKQYTIAFAETLQNNGYSMLRKMTKSVGVDYQLIINYFQLIGVIVDDGKVRFVDVVKR